MALGVGLERAMHHDPPYKKVRWCLMANEHNLDMMADGNIPDQTEDDDEEPDFDVTRFQVIASGDTFVRYDTFTGVAWILQNPGTPGVARWVAVAEPEEEVDA
jgi:hypothetical protein